MPGLILYFFQYQTTANLVCASYLLIYHPLSFTFPFYMSQYIAQNLGLMTTKPRTAASSSLDTEQQLGPSRIWECDQNLQQMPGKEWSGTLLLSVPAIQLKNGNLFGHGRPSPMSNPCVNMSLNCSKRSETFSTLLRESSSDSIKVINS